MSQNYLWIVPIQQPRSLHRELKNTFKVITWLLTTEMRACVNKNNEIVPELQVVMTKSKSDYFKESFKIGQVLIIHKDKNLVIWPTAL